MTAGPSDSRSQFVNKLSLKAKNNRLVKLVFKTPWMGIYPSYQQALAAIPADSRIGYNQQETFDVFRTLPIDRVRPADYPIMLHLRELLRENQNLVDLGGSIGMMYYTTKKYLTLPEGLEWVVCDVPKMTDAGRELAAREADRSRQLHFVNDLGSAGNADVLFSSGALQFIEKPLPELLKELPQLPPAVLINRIPAWDYEPFATIHDIGFCLAPYQIFNRPNFISAMQAIGYTLADSWSCPESTFSVRFHPRIRLSAYSGFYFSLPR